MISALASILLLLAPTTATTSAADQQQPMTNLRSRLIRSVIPEAADAHKALSDQAARHAKSLLADGSWPDVDYADQERTFWRTEVHAHRVLAMAKAYRIAENAELLAKALAALDYWLDKDFQNPNWWHNQIGTPQVIGEAAVLLGRENITGDRRAKVDRIMSRSTWQKWVGQNLIWGVTNQILRALIDDDAEMIKQAYDRFYEEIRFTTDEGVQPDASFHQHGPQFYSGGYGLAFAIDVARFTAYAWGTPWQIPADKVEFLNRFILDGQRWMMWYDVFDYSAKGREIVRKGLTAQPRDWTGGPVTPRGAAYSLANAVKLLADQPIPRQKEYRSWLPSLAGDPKAFPLVGNRHYWRSDYMAHRRPYWMASVRMFSDRLINTELVNDEGKKSQHLADGANFIYVRGDEYADIFPAWDWTKVPGTTAEQGTLDFEDGRELGVKGRTSFVGGVSDGEWGLAAMDLSRGTLRARKSWFFFDAGYVCLGAGIHCDSDRDVATAVNQCRLRGEVNRAANWFHHDNVGYVVLEHGGDVQLTTGKQSGDWSDIGTNTGRVETDVFSLWIDHGSRPRDATYAYAVYPAANATLTARRAADSELQVIVNTPEHQAVSQRYLGVIAAAFYEPGAIDVAGRKLAVDRPCLILVRGDRIAVSNPQNQPAVVNVTIKDTTIRVELPGGEMAGSTVVVPLHR